MRAKKFTYFGEEGAWYLYSGLELTKISGL